MRTFFPALLLCVHSLIVPVGTSAAVRYVHSSIHRRLYENGTALYYVFDRQSEQIVDINAEIHLARYMNPCGNEWEKPKITKSMVDCHSSVLQNHISENSSFIYDAVCSELQVGYTTSGEAFIEPGTVTIYSATEDKCSCVKQCEQSESTSRILRFPLCYCDQGDIDRIQTCDFSSPCEWHSLAGNLEFKLYNRTYQQAGYRMIVQRYALAIARGGQTASLVSSYYQQTAFTCSLTFSYFIYGNPQSTLTVLMETKDEGSSHHSSHVLRTITYINHHQSLSPITVSIGHVHRPSRVRLVCSPGNGTKDTKCAITDLTWNDCEVHYFVPDPCPDMVNPFVCHRDGHSVCLQDVACDGIEDCPGGSDELNCDSQRPNMTCRFETAELCEGWTISTRDYEYPTIINATVDENGYLISEPEWHDREPGLGSIARQGSGSFLFFSSSWLHSMDYPENQMILTSPLLPPTLPDRRDPEFGRANCTLRFLYTNNINTEAFEILLRPSNPTEPRKVIWTPPIRTAQFTKEWLTASVPIPQQPLPFYLEIEAFYDDIEKIFVAIDDLSLSPSCFHGGSTTDIPDEVRISSCGATGADPPEMEDCLREAVENERSETILHGNGTQTWTAGITAEHWVRVCGGSGGSFTSGEIVHGLGECVTVRVNLSIGNQLTMTIGQKGSSPCQLRDPERKTIRGRQELFDYVCGRDNTTVVSKLDDVIPGAGGGGATVFWKDYGDPFLVAGGGGGGFPKEFRKTSHAVNKDFAGFGASAMNITRLSSNCSFVCDMATPSSFLTRGLCPSDSSFSVSGGYGGGAAACGSAGAGGAGYIGGSYGLFDRGQDGSSWVDEDEVIEYRVEKSMDDGNGFVEIHACSLSCPATSSCQFTSVKSASMKCRCENSALIEQDEECPIYDPTTLSLPTSIIIVSFIVIVAFGLYCALLTTDTRIGRKWKTFLLKTGHGPIVTAKELSNIGMRVTSDNLIEEIRSKDQSALRSMSDRDLLGHVPYIPEGCIVINEALGKGAFGVVYRGTVTIKKDTVAVAIKVLSANLMKEQQVRRQFLMEAVLMRVSNTENDATIRMLGVSFTDTAHMIIMELMDGGNLLDYLRSCRATQSDSNPQNMTVRGLVNMALDVAEGCSVIESLRYVHRDLAARNCLLTTRDGGMKVKIGDFGLAKELYVCYYHAEDERSTMLPIKWMPPEAIEDGLYCSKTDVWSFGVLCWEIFSLGRVPYPTESAKSVLSLLRRGERLETPEGTPNKIADLMSQCWSSIPDDRPSFTSIRDQLLFILSEPSLDDMPFCSTSFELESDELSVAESPVTPITPMYMDTPCTVITEISTPTKREFWGYDHTVPYATAGGQGVVDRNENKEANCLPSQTSTINDSNSENTNNHRVINTSYCRTDNVEADASATETTPILQEPSSYRPRPDKLLLQTPLYR